MENSVGGTILVVNDVEATRLSVKEMLERDGYKVLTLRDEVDATEQNSHLNGIDLILVSLEGETDDVIESSKRIREIIEAGNNVPIVIFCDGIPTNTEVLVENDIYSFCPDDFNQLRECISRVLAHSKKEIET